MGAARPTAARTPASRDDVLVAADDDFTQGAFGESVCSLRNGEDNLEFFRAYAPELVAWFDGFSHSGYADALGGVGRVVDDRQHLLAPPCRACPNLLDLPTHGQRAARRAHDRPRPALPRLGRAARRRDLDPGDDSVPFTDDGHLTDGEGGDCDPDQIIPGP